MLSEAAPDIFKKYTYLFTEKPMINAATLWDSSLLNRSISIPGKQQTLVILI